MAAGKPIRPRNRGTKGKHKPKNPSAIRKGGNNPPSKTVDKTIQCNDGETPINKDKLERVGNRNTASSTERKFSLNKSGTVSTEQASYNPYQRLYSYDPIADFFMLGPDAALNKIPTHPEALALLHHPCRGCPHLYVAYTPDQYAPTKPNPSPSSPNGPKYDNSTVINVNMPAYSRDPQEKLGYVMPKPLCLAFPKDTQRNRSTGQTFIDYKETLNRCPLYGVKSINEVIETFNKRLEELENKFISPE